MLLDQIKQSSDIKKLTEEEYPQPWSATLTGTLDPEQVRALSKFLSQSLGIPTERQTWKTYG